MNHTYRLVWNDAEQCQVPAPENARGRGKRTSVKPLAAAMLAAFACNAYALPTGGAITVGAGSVAQSGATMTVNQTTQNLAINWQSFGIGANESVNFNQPNASAIALNRVLGSDTSQIHGQLNANGQVWVLNPNGVLFGKGAQVNVGGLVASTLNISDADFLAGKRTFSSPRPQAGEGLGVRVVNQGSITAADGGYVALLGGQISNEGVIAARLGTVALAAGNKITLDFNGDQLLNVQVEQGALDALAQNSQLIRADGGTVLMTAQAADALATAVVNNTGVIEARSIENRNGVIKLLGDMDHGTVNVGGTLDASAPNGGNGGFVETSAAHVKIADGAVVTTKSENGQSGTWLIDPVDFTIAAGGGALTVSGIGATTLSTSLGLGNVAIATDAGTAGNGDIFVNAAVSWNANKLTLTAHRNININANLNGSGTASLALEYGQGAVAAGNTSNYYLSNGAKVNLPAGNNFSTKLGSDGATTNWTVITALGAAGSVTGTDLQGMSGNLAGNYVLGADIAATTTSGWNAGSGFAPIGALASQFTGNFSGLGHTVTGLTINRLATPYVGLFGYSTGTLRDVGLLNSNISGQVVVGALAGRSNGSISYSYADGGSVTTDLNIAGGLVGQIGGSIDYSYANVAVTGNSNGLSSTAIGGLVGSALAGSSIGNSYATGSVNGGTDVGGLAGQSAGTITNAYSTGAVSWTTSGGGLVGLNIGTVTNSYWDTTTSGTLASAAGTGLTTTQMQTMSSFAGWDIANSGGSSAVWRIYEGQSYPLLRNFLAPLTVTANNASKTYDGLAYNGSGGVTYSVNPNSSLLGTLSYGGGINAGSYAITPSGLYSTQQGYDIAYGGGTLTVAPAALTVVANNAAKTYDGLAWSGNNGATYSGFVNGETSAVLGGTLNYGGTSQGAINAGSYAITPGGLTSGNYAISFVDGTLTVSPAALSVTANNAIKTYDGLAWSGNNGVIYSGFVNGETSAVLGGALTYGGNSQGAIDAGSYAITPGGLTAGNYAITFNDGTLTVNPALLSVTANDASRFYDGRAYTGGNGATYSGFVNGETSAVLGGVLVYGGTSQGAVDAGSYAITPGGLTSGNYAIAFNDGMLSINQRIPAIPSAPVDSYSGATDRMAGTASGAVETSAVAPADAANGKAGTEGVKLSPDAAASASANQYVLVTQGCGLRLPQGLDCR